MARSETVEAYLASFPPDIQVILQRVRESILDVVPGAEEKISYGIPTVSLGGKHFVYFAGWKHHVGIYPVPRADGELEQALAPYRAAKDSLNFPYAKPIPYDLIVRVAEFLTERKGLAG